MQFVFKLNLYKLHYKLKIMNNFKNLNKMAIIALLVAPTLVGCSSDDPESDNGGGGLGPLTPGNTEFGKDTGNFTAAEWYPGGELGTTTNRSYSASTTPVDDDADMLASFNRGEDMFEKIYTITDAPRKGLGPAWVRNGCIKCHPSYGHGKRQTESQGYKASSDDNGYLLVVYHPEHATTSDGVEYTTNNSSYISEVTGMPQTAAMAPFKAPIEESGIHLTWPTVTDMPSGLAEYAGNGTFKFPDGETFSLIYPEITIDESAFNTNPKPSNYEVRLESTIGIYGTGLLDAIDEDEMKKQYQSEAAVGVKLNELMWDKAANDWSAKAWYTLADGTKKIKKFTYAMTRASLQDGPGANAIWNITNVTRSDRHYLYTTPAWAKAMSEDNDVISYIKANGKDETSILHPYWANGTDEEIAKRVNEILSCNKAPKAGEENAFEKYLFKGAPYNSEEEQSDKDYYDFMVWHRGLAVPAARDLGNAQVQRGKEIFNQIGCQYCHRPSWKTGKDNYWVDNAIKAYAQKIGKDPNTMLPKYANQTIWPYTDLVQHRLFMKNDIRTGWCRTTPLWGRGLSRQLTGADDRLHDCRARTVIEAIMWHGYSKDSQAFNAAKKFYNLPKADRDAVVAFINAI